VDRILQLDEATKTMWSWFQQWATIARTLDFNKRQRLRMGISRYKRNTTPEEADQEEEPAAPTAEPAPAM